jgi:L-seryl-tRNA(Ser) seleniumtransferase
VELDGADVEALARALRSGEPPVVGHIRDDRLLLDLRTVLPGQEGVLARRVVEATAS